MSGSRRLRGLLVVAGLAVLAVLAALAAIQEGVRAPGVWCTRDGDPFRASTRVDPHVTAVIPTDSFEVCELDEPCVAADAAGVWLLRRRERELVRVDPRTNIVVARIGLGRGLDASWAPQSLAIGDGAVWVFTSRLPPAHPPPDGSRPSRPGRYLPVVVQRVDPATNAVANLRLPTRRLAGPLPAGLAQTGGTQAAAAAGGAVWLIGFGDQVVRLDEASGAIKAIAVGAQVRDLAAVDGGVWLATDAGLVRLNLSGNATTGRPITPGPDQRYTGLAATSDGLWAMVTRQLREGPMVVPTTLDRVVRLDPASGRVLASVPVAHGSTELVGLRGGDGLLAVALTQAHTCGFATEWQYDVSVVDARSGHVRVRAGIDDNVADVAVGAGAVWIAEPSTGRLLRVDPSS